MSSFNYVPYVNGELVEDGQVVRYDITANNLTSEDKVSTYGSDFENDPMTLVYTTSELKSVLYLNYYYPLKEEMIRSQELTPFNPTDDGESYEFLLDVCTRTLIYSTITESGHSDYNMIVSDDPTATDERTGDYISAGRAYMNTNDLGQYFQVGKTEELLDATIEIINNGLTVDFNLENAKYVSNYIYFTGNLMLSEALPIDTDFTIVYYVDNSDEPYCNYITILAGETSVNFNDIKSSSSLPDLTEEEYPYITLYSTGSNYVDARLEQYLNGVHGRVLATSYKITCNYTSFVDGQFLITY